MDEEDNRELLYEINPFVNDFYNSHKQQFVKCIISSIFDEIKWSELEEYTDTLVQIIDSLLDEQGKKFTDIRKEGSGFYSTVFSIGDKILKIGEPRATFSIPNHPRILQPLDRENFVDNNGRPIACVEITEKVGKVNILNFNINTLYAIYKELREDGILWADARLQNVGVLNHTNRPQYKGEEFENNPNFIGMEGKVEEDKVLQERRICYLGYGFVV